MVATTATMALKGDTNHYDDRYRVGPEGALGPQGAQGEQGSPGPAGAQGQAAAVWHIVPSAPASDLGNDGDFAMVISGTELQQIYRKESGSWVLKVETFA